MNFHINFTPKRFPFKISHSDNIMLIGSCFTENIGEKLLTHKFNILQNPNGILFNPVSVSEALQNYITNKEFNKTDLFFLNEQYHSWQHHSRFSGINEDIVLKNLNKSCKQSHTYLKSADYLLITLGSSWLYFLSDSALGYKTNKVAANNHKAPADWFKKKLMTYNSVFELLQILNTSLKNFNPSLKIIYTISPVRHIREGLIENNRSKAVLISAVNDIAEQTEDVFYFPAYELVIDDLRDYRFYAEDMVHPNYAATNYVWEKFIETAISNHTHEMMNSFYELSIAAKHKPFNAESEAHKKFREKYLSIALSFQSKYSHINFQSEIDYFKD